MRLLPLLARGAAARSRRGRRARGHGDAGQRPAPRDAAGGRAPRAWAAATGSSPGSGTDFLQGGTGPRHARRRAGRRPRRDVVRRSTRRRSVRGGSRRRERRPPGCSRTRLRGRRPAPLPRPVHDGRRPARDAGRAGQLHVRPNDRRHVPGRTPLRRRRDERRAGRSRRTTARTWRSGLLPGLTTASRPPGPNTRASDPVVAYDAAHATWLISTLALEGPTTRLAINRSPNGATWSTASNALEERAAEGIAFDKNWLACDNTASSPFYGRCYLVYTHSADRDMLAVSWSTDGGLTWSTPVDIGARPGVGVFPAIRPTGEVVVVYLLQGGGFSIAASRSADGGATWGALGPHRRGRRRLPDPGLPCVLAAERRGRPERPRLGEPGTTASPRARRETTPCSSPRRRTASSGARRSRSPAGGTPSFLPSGPTRRRGGSRSRTCARAPAGIDVELVESPGAPATWSPARRLSAQSMPLRWMPDTTSGRMLGDYISVHYARGRPLVVWVLANEPVGASFRQAVYATRG